MFDNEPDPFGDAITAGAAVIFFAITGPFILPFWLIGKLALWIEKKWFAA